MMMVRRVGSRKAECWKRKEETKEKDALRPANTTGRDFLTDWVRLLSSTTNAADSERHCTYPVSAMIQVFSTDYPYLIEL